MKRLHLHLLVTVALTVAAAPAVAQQPTRAQAQTAADKAQRDAAKSRASLMATLRGQVLDVLKDPASAQFRREYISDAEDDKPIMSLCGELNSKNAYGGYVGFGRFVATTDRLIVLEADLQTDGFPAIWDTWCSRPQR